MLRSPSKAGLSILMAWGTRDLREVTETQVFVVSCYLFGFYFGRKLFQTNKFRVLGRPGGKELCPQDQLSICDLGDRVGSQISPRGGEKRVKTDSGLWLQPFLKEGIKTKILNVSFYVVCQHYLLKSYGYTSLRLSLQFFRREDQVVESRLAECW